MIPTSSTAPRNSAPTSCGSACKVGGVLTGEHGVGIEKRDLMPEMFSEIDLDQQQRVKCAFDDQGPAQSRQGLSHAAPLRRAGPHACEGRPAALRRHSEILMAAVVETAARRPSLRELVRTGRRRRSRSSAPAPSAALAARCRRRATLDMSAFAGIIAYEPEELILEAGAGTPLAEIEALIAARGQQLAFEPPDLSRLLGSAHAAARWAGSWPATSRGRAASRPARRAITCWASAASRAAARSSRPARAW